MSKALELAKYYFDLSNDRKLDEIENMFRHNSTYSSQNTGVHLGKERIMDMTRKFFDSHSSLYWDVHSVDEVQPGVIKFDFTLSATRSNGESYDRPGIEYVIIYDKYIQHVEVRNK